MVQIEKNLYYREISYIFTSCDVLLPPEKTDRIKVLPTRQSAVLKRIAALDGVTGRESDNTQKIHMMRFEIRLNLSQNSSKT